MLRLQGHEVSSLRRPWSWLQIAVVVLPLSPAVAAVLTFAAVVSVGRSHLWDVAYSRLHWAITALGVWLICVTALIGRGDAWLGLANFVPFLLVFPFLSVMVRTGAQVRRLGRCVVVGAAAIALIGLGQLFLGWQGPIRLGVIDWILAPGGAPVGRLSSTFEYANVAATYLAVGWVFALAWAVEAGWDGWRRWRSERDRAGTPGKSGQLQSGQLQSDQLRSDQLRSDQLRSDQLRSDQLRSSQLRSSQLQSGQLHRRSILRFGIVLLLTALIGVALLLTHSRSAWGLAALATLAESAYLGWWWPVIAAIALLLVILAAAFAPNAIALPLRRIVPELIWARLNDQLYPDRPLATLRSTQWDFAWDMATDRPLTGWGLRSFTPTYEAATQTWLGHPHNLFLMLAAETGFPAAIGLFAIIGWVLGRGIIWLLQTSQWSERDRFGYVVMLLAFGAIGLFHLFDVTLFDLRINLLGWLLLAAIWGPVRQHTRPPRL
jgi:hypothetical protein